MPLRREYSMPLNAMRPRIMRPTTTQKPKSSPPNGKLTRFEAPGLCVNLLNPLDVAETGPFKLPKNSSSSRSIRLAPGELKKLNLKPQLEEMARNYYYNPECGTFTPFPINTRPAPRESMRSTLGHYRNTPSSLLQV